MHDIKRMSDEELRHSTKEAVTRSRQGLMVVVDHLAEVEARGLYARWGFDSMWVYCEKELRLLDGVAHLRLTLARLVNKRPEVRPLLLAGELGECSACELTRYADSPEFGELLAKAMTMSKRKFKDYLDSRSPVPTPKRELIRRLGGEVGTGAAAPDDGLMKDKFPLLSSQRMLAFPEPDESAEAKPAVSKAGPKTHRITFNASEQDVAMLKKLQDRLGTSEVGEVLSKAMDALLEKADPERREAKREKRAAARQARKTKMAEGQTKTSEAHPPRRRRLGAAAYDEVLLRDEQRCTYEVDGIRCGQRRHLQVDHIIPFALGGGTSLENSRTLCAMHNRLLARDIFGDKVPRKVPKPVEVSAEAI